MFWLLGILVARGTVTVLTLNRAVEPGDWFYGLAYLFLFASCTLFLPRSITAKFRRPHFTIWILATLGYLVAHSILPAFSGLIINYIRLPLEPSYLIYFIFITAGEITVFPLLLIGLRAAAGMQMLTAREFGGTARKAIPVAGLVALRIALGVFASYTLASGQDISKGLYLLLQLVDSTLHFLCILLAIALIQIVRREEGDRRNVFE